MLARRLSLTVLTALTVASSAAAAQAATHPVIVDAPGDARDALGRNQPVADLLTADLSTDGTNLIVSERLASLPAANTTNTTTYELSFNLPGRAGTARSTIFPGNTNTSAYAEIASTSGDADVIAVGALTIDRASSTVTARYPLSDINGYVQAGDSPAITAGTNLGRPTANASLTRTFLNLSDAHDAASATAEYIFGQ